jgi:hypothetical protein
MSAKQRRAHTLLRRMRICFNDYKNLNWDYLLEGKKNPPNFSGRIKNNSARKISLCRLVVFINLYKA